MKKKKSLAFEKNNLIILIVLLITFALTLFLYILLDSSHLINSENINTDNNQTLENLVAKVIDGDTFELSSGERVRLICIDAPEENQEGFEESKAFLETLILDKQVVLESDVSDKDSYNRLLRYIYVNDSNGNEIFVNKEMVKQGYASLFRFEPDVKKCDEIES